MVKLCPEVMQLMSVKLGCAHWFLTETPHDILPALLTRAWVELRPGCDGDLEPSLCRLQVFSQPGGN